MTEIVNGVELGLVAGFRRNGSVVVDYRIWDGAKFRTPLDLVREINALREKADKWDANEKWGIRLFPACGHFGKPTEENRCPVCAELAYFSKTKERIVALVDAIRAEGSHA